MDSMKKRALLARIEGQLAAMQAGRADQTRARQRINWALAALAGLSRGDEAQRLAALRRQLDVLEPERLLPRSVRSHHCTLARVDCLLWQLALRNNAALHVAA